MTTNTGITGITLTTDEGSVTVTPEAFDRYAASLTRGGSMSSATATLQRTPLVIPVELDFGDEAYLTAPALEEIAEGLIEQHHATLGHIADLEVAILWKKSGGKRGGHAVFGKTSKRGGLLSAFTTADFIVWLAADHVAEAAYTPKQITALLHHELLHIGWQEPDEDDEAGEGKAVLVGHDFELFAEELRVYGAWEEMLKQAATAFEQAELFDD